MVTDVVNRQYPHYLYKRTSSGEAVQDANGSWHTSGGAWTFHSRCREETNGKGTQIQAASGKFVTFASLIQIPVGVERIPEGTEVAIADEPLEPSALLDQESMAEAKITGKVRISGECLKFDKGRLHSRLWV